MARSRRTPAMLVGRCSSELSGHNLQGNLAMALVVEKLRDETQYTRSAFQ
jgi:hypothetical protein